jgi:hypothetical protein
MPDTVADPNALFARERLALKSRQPPVVIVGLPRSGSSYLSHVMSCLNDWFVFDDLYLYRKAVSIGAEGPLSRDHLEQLVFFLGWQIRARLQFDRDFLALRCTRDEVDRMDEALLETFTDEVVEWHELLEEWLVRLALRHGCSRWGYKAPQDFMHMPMLAKLFPGVRFVLLVRDPRNNMASAKYVSGEDGDPRHFHPLIHARYWKMAQSLTFQHAEGLNLPLHVVRFEDLVADPDGSARDIARFLGADFQGPVPDMGANTSFRGGKRKGLTETEKWICERVNGPLMRRFGYSLAAHRPRLRDLPDLAATSLRFASYQTTRFVREPSARVSMGAFFRNLRKGALPGRREPRP